MTNGEEKGKRANEPLRETFLMPAQLISWVVISVFTPGIFKNPSYKEFTESLPLLYMKCTVVILPK